METDILVIGSGIAGLSYTLKVAEERPGTRIAIVTKGRAEDSNTLYAQGGIAVAIDPLDAPEKHFEDTIRAGQGLSDIQVTRMVVENALPRIQDLIKWGVVFDQRPDRSFDLHLEGGHSGNRVVHCKDRTGSQVERILLQEVLKWPNIKIYEEHFAVDLIIEAGSAVSERPVRQCRGAVIYDEHTGQLLSIFAKVTVLASGGSGQVYDMTTNPGIACGDGVAMAYRAGASVRDMHFIQFHPTAFYDPNNASCFLISEAVRGFGAYLVNRDGDRFMLNYSEHGELATRDVVSMAIQKELSVSGDTNVFLDCRHLDDEAFSSHFPTIAAYCAGAQIDIGRDIIPVIPAAHYQCGGIKVDLNSCTDMQGLLAIGECASTGLHGANRLASNSLLEALVYAHQAYLYTMGRLDESNNTSSHSPCYIENQVICHPWVITRLRKKLKQTMSRYAGINRTEESLLRAHYILSRIQHLAQQYFEKYRLTVPLLELRNMAQVALLIVGHAMQDFETRRPGKYLRDKRHPSHNMV